MVNRTLDSESTEFKKAVGQFHLALNSVMKPLRLYGQDYYVDSASKEIESLALQLHGRLLGIDKPYEVNHDNLHH